MLLLWSRRQISLLLLLLSRAPRAVSMESAQRRRVEPWHGIKGKESAAAASVMQEKWVRGGWDNNISIRSCGYAGYTSRFAGANSH
jgi:hypothetical protein